MELKNLLVGILLGCAQLLLGVGLKKPLVGLLGLILTFAVACFYPLAALILFPICLLCQMLIAGGEAEIPIESSEPPAPINAENKSESAFCIIAISGPLNGQRYFITRNNPSLDFGRENCEVLFPVDTKGVGRHHCRVTLQGDRLFLVDCNSSYGTYLAEPLRRLAPGASVELHDGTEFCLARMDIVFKVKIYSV